MASWEECFNSEYVDNHTTLCAALDVALDDFLVVKSCIHALPTLAQTCLLVREKQLAFFVFLVLYIDFNDVACLQVRIVTELRCGDDTVALVADVYDYLFLVNRNDFSVYDLMIGNLVKCFVVSFLKFFFAYACA